ncbi:lipoma-preferred partner homolog isoform X1 [Haliotis cracherodii]|uniref:lipoma-preferred partner homolog isoform X1 n=1 Tax=Haliotis cracherodii TaxID=6455 RepID=UPI0039ED2F8E
MSYQQGLERDFAQMHVQDRGGIHLPPALAPKPKPYNPAPAPYRPVPGQQKAGQAAFRQVYHDGEDFPPPPPQTGYSEEHAYPPPPPPEQVRGYMYQQPLDDFPPPPPPQASQGYEYRDNQYGGGPKTANYMNQVGYRDSPGPYNEYGSSPGAYSRGPEGRNSPYMSGQSNYANVNVVSGKHDYGRASPSTFRAEPAQGRQDRPVPGPQVPSSSEQLVSTVAPSEKEAEVDALTSLLMQSMESSGDPDYFGMCSKCSKKVLGDINGCKAMDQVFHINCFTCVTCNLKLQGKSFFALENKPYCEVCYMNTLEKCSICSKPITDRLLRATGKPYHPDCFVCVVCGKSLDGVPFTVDATNQIHCIEDFHKKFAPRCCSCQLPIMPETGQDETVRIVAMDKSFHVDCYRCEDCGMQLSSEAEGRGCYPLDDHILCKNCNAKRIQQMTTKMATEL